MEADYVNKQCTIYQISSRQKIKWRENQFQSDHNFPTVNILILVIYKLLVVKICLFLYNYE